MMRLAQSTVTLLLHKRQVQRLYVPGIAAFQGKPNHDAPCTRVFGCRALPGAVDLLGVLPAASGVRGGEKREAVLLGVERRALHADVEAHGAPGAALWRVPSMQRVFSIGNCWMSLKYVDIGSESILGQYVPPDTMVQFAMLQFEV